MAIYKRNDIKLMPKLKAAHYVLRHVREEFKSLPFSASSFDSLAKARMGLAELRKLDMVDPLYPMRVHTREQVVRVCWTVMLTDKDVVRICGLPQAQNVQSD